MKSTAGLESKKEAVDQNLLPIVFYDAECGLCDHSIQWVIAHDQEKIFHFAPLQGDTALSLIGSLHGQSSDWTIVYLDEDGRYDRSTAVLKIAQRLKWGRGLPNLFLAIPATVRDIFYRFVAKIRYRVFGKIEACQLPAPSVRARFLP